MLVLHPYRVKSPRFHPMYYLFYNITSLNHNSGLIIIENVGFPPTTAPRHDIVYYLHHGRLEHPTFQIDVQLSHILQSVSTVNWDHLPPDDVVFSANMHTSMGVPLTMLLHFFLIQKKIIN